MQKKLVKIYDTTLRDGTQGEGISFSKVDKVLIAERLDEFGVSYIEGGWPGSNPKDMAFFETMRSKKLKHAKLTAFGSTRRANNTPEEDANLQTLLAADTPVITIFGKSWLLHVHEVLRVKPEVNLEMIESSCHYLCTHNREIIFDAEHFFDGYKDNAKYSILALQHAVNGGASTVVLCDTNGGSLPMEIVKICTEVRQALPTDVEIGIHCHNDSCCAVANSLSAVGAGVSHIQGTMNGIGERCGNADLCSIIPALHLKMNCSCIPNANLKDLCNISQYIFDIANMRPQSHLPYVGRSAFAHKGGMHVNAVAKNATTFEHITPKLVGNERRILVSDLSGGSNIVMKAKEHNISLDGKSPVVREILETLKEHEAEGYEYESAGASFKLLVQKFLKQHRSFFELEGFRVLVEKRSGDDSCISQATVKLKVGNESEITVAEGDGPINALDLAMRKALHKFYPQISGVALRDYKVRIVDGDDGTAAKTLVMIESGDTKDNYWSTVGLSENIIEASWEALVDSVEYILYEQENINLNK